jgi:hypothetical protein
MEQICRPRYSFHNVARLGVPAVEYSQAIPATESRRQSSALDQVLIDLIANGDSFLSPVTTCAYFAYSCALSAILAEATAWRSLWPDALNVGLAAVLALNHSRKPRGEKR